LIRPWNLVLEIRGFMSMGQKEAFLCNNEKSDLLFFTLDDQGIIGSYQCLNPEFIDAEQATGQPFQKVFPPEVSETFETALSALISTQRPQRIQFRWKRGEYALSYVAHVAPLEAAGRWTTLIVVWNETDRERSVQARLKSEESYRLLAENVTDVISICGLDGTLRYLSPNVAKLTGYSAEILTRENRVDLWHMNELVQAVLVSARKTSSSRAGTARARHLIQHKAGHWLWVETDGRLIEWEGQKSIICTTRDITLLQEAEEVAVEMMQSLKIARQKAEAASQAKSEFLAHLSHELRTPLHGILGMAELLSQTHLTVEQQQYLDALNDSGNILFSLVNDLQDLSKIEVGHLDLQEVSFDLIETVEGLADFLNSQAEAKGLTLHCHVMAGVPSLVKGDPMRLRQVLINLIGNAIKFTDHGEIKVMVRRTEGYGIRFSVQDTGVGLSAEKSAMISQALTAPNGTRHIGQGGIGLGLSIANHLLVLMGGKLEVTSLPGQGSTFYFELQLLPATRDATISEDLSGLSILLTERNPATRQWMCGVLERAGADVDQASGGVEVIHLLQNNPRYSCAILDGDLSDLDGSTLASLIRSNSALTQIPLLLVTTADNSIARPRESPQGLNAILIKPIREQVLLAAVKQTIATGVFAAAEDPAKSDLTVLVVEDNATNLRLAREVLSHAGYRVLGAHDGEEALRLLRRHRVDAVLMDIELPNMDGVETTANIRQEPAWAQIPIIAMTAHAMKGDAERFLQAGLDDYLSKPVNQKELLEVLAREISKRTQHASIA
jgi:two-component system, sensor histidine kinase and response regulator